MLPDFSHPIYNSEAAAIAHLESIVWPDGPVCPHCNENRGRAYKLEGVRGSKSRAQPDGAPRLGLWKCAKCRKQFTVRMNTMYENAHVPLHKAFRAHAFFHEYGRHHVKSVARDIGVNYKTALRLADLMT
mgnify:CR=1 FL=1|jgi:transposase-like protein|tara:strand:- start:1422 stop:1811 length:390 start_codon:yes stop_codon:yes gene_type:complete